MIQIAFSLIGLLTLDQNAHQKVNLYAMDRHLFTGSRLTSNDVKSEGVFESVNDDALYNKLYTFAVNLSRRQELKRNIDARMVIELIDGDSTITLSFSQFDFLALNSRVVNANVDSIVAIVRNHIPPKYHWYVPTAAELKNYIDPRPKLFFDSLLRNSKKPKKKKG